MEVPESILQRAASFPRYDISNPDIFSAEFSGQDGLARLRVGKDTRPFLLPQRPFQLYLELSMVFRTCAGGEHAFSGLESFIHIFSCPLHARRFAFFSHPLKNSQKQGLT